MEFKDFILCIINIYIMARLFLDDSNRLLSDYIENFFIISDYFFLIDISFFLNFIGSVDSVGSLVLGSIGSEIEIFFFSVLDIFCR